MDNDMETVFLPENCNAGVSWYAASETATFGEVPIATWFGA